MHKSAVVAKGSDSRATVPLPVPAPLACPASRQLRDRLRAMVADVVASWKAQGMPAGLRTAAGLRAEAESIAAWDELVARHGLVAHSLDALVNQSHHYVDMLLDRRIIEAGGLPQMVSAIKIRKAGFTECCDSLDSLLFWLRRMVETRLLPPDLI